jgi:Predicted membrane protein/domain
MMNDSVREELQTKINTAPPNTRKEPVPYFQEIKPYVPEVKPYVPADLKPFVPAEVKIAAPADAMRPAQVEVKPPVAVSKPVSVAHVAPARTRIKYDTSELAAPKTSPTLVGFQAKNPVVPDWRLQLQNAVRGRNSGTHADAVADEGSIYRKQLVTSGANALKVEYVEAPKPVQEHKDPRVANALKRINESRKVFLPEGAKHTNAPAKTEPTRSFPFNVVGKTSEADISQAEAKASVNVLPKPKLVSTFRIEKKEFDTNKLPPLEEVMMPVEIVGMPMIAADEARYDVMAYGEPDVHATRSGIDAESIETEETDSVEIEDLAPFSMRFNSGVFDLIIGGFASLILLSPVAFFGGNWFSFGGVLAFAAAWSITMFVYLTVCIGLYGRSIGMRLFSLEIVDADENAYPTFHQAAVSSAVYLLSLPLLGLGFLTVLFNEEKRAAHDLLSGTIIVNEF